MIGLKHIVRWMFIIFVVLWMFLSCTMVGAMEQQTTVTVTNEQAAGESRSQVEEITLMQALQDVVEQTGTQISSSTTTQGTYTKDVVYAAASSIVKVQTKSYAWHGNVLTGTFSFSIDADREEYFLKKYADDANAVLQYKQMRDEYQSLRQDIAALKQKLKETKDPEEANQISEQIKNKNQRYLSAIWCEKALTQRMEKDYENALISCDTAIAIDPAFPNNYGLKADIYDDMGNEEEAIRFYQKVLDLDSGYAVSYHNIAVIYHKRGEDAKALPYIDQAIQLAPYTIESYVLRASIYGSMENLAKELENYNQALALDSRHYDALAGKAMVENQIGRYQEAFQDASQAISIRPEKFDGYAFRAFAEVFLGGRRKALEDVEQAIRYCQEPKMKESLLQLRSIINSLG